MEEIRFKNCIKGYPTSLQLRTLIVIVGYRSVTLPRGSIALYIRLHNVARLFVFWSQVLEYAQMYVWILIV
jgi:hypothetical protein